MDTYYAYYSSGTSVVSKHTICIQHAEEELVPTTRSMCLLSRVCILCIRVCRLHILLESSGRLFYELVVL